MQEKPDNLLSRFRGQAELEKTLSLLIHTHGEKTVREKLDELTTKDSSKVTYGDFREMLDHLNSRMGIKSEA